MCESHVAKPLTKRRPRKVPSELLRYYLHLLASQLGLPHQHIHMYRGVRVVSLVSDAVDQLDPGPYKAIDGKFG